MTITTQDLLEAMMVAALKPDREQQIVSDNGMGQSEVRDYPVPSALMNLLCPVLHEALAKPELRAEVYRHVLAAAPRIAKAIVERIPVQVVEKVSGGYGRADTVRIVDWMRAPLTDALRAALTPSAIELAKHRIDANDLDGFTVQVTVNLVPTKR